MSDSTGAGNPSDRGLQAERTTLSWTRTSFAFLVNGALLTIRNLHGSIRPAGLIPALLAGVVALGTFLIAVQRQRTLQRQPLPERITPRLAVHTIGTAVLVLIVVTMVAQFV